MSVSFDKAFDRLIGHEAGYVNDPADPGGETKYGISKRSYPHLDIRNLSLGEAKNIYFRDYWMAVGVDASDAVRFQVFDFGVNSGIGTAVRKLQVALNVADDGNFGPRSQYALAHMPESDVLMRYLAVRLDFMTRLKNWPDHGKGWSRRIAANLMFAAEDNDI